MKDQGKGEYNTYSTDALIQAKADEILLNPSKTPGQKKTLPNSQYATHSQGAWGGSYGAGNKKTNEETQGRSMDQTLLLEVPETSIRNSRHLGPPPSSKVLQATGKELRENRRAPAP